MDLRSIVRDGLGSISRRSIDSWWKDWRKGRSTVSAATDDAEAGCVGGENGHLSLWGWGSLPPELLREIVKRVEQSEREWPGRRSVVACASVCRSWRWLCKEIVAAPEACGRLTFPESLKQPGSRNGPIQCYIKRNKATSTYQLFLGLDTDNGKFLMAARKIRRPTYAEYVISLAAEDISKNSANYMGRLKSNFFGTKFAVYDSQPPHGGAVTSTGRSSRLFYSKKVSPKVPSGSGSSSIAHIAYELNMLGARGPRRMRCVMNSIPTSALEPDGTVPALYRSSSSQPTSQLHESFSSPSLLGSMDHLTFGDLKVNDAASFAGSMRSISEVAVDVGGKDGPLILRNKPPRWHEQLQCWCLNFRGRVTIASVKNFQLVAASPGESTAETAATGAETTRGAAAAPPPAAAAAGPEAAAHRAVDSTARRGSSDRDKIILQFGRIGKDLFTMDYRYPLSAFQAFAICLTSFDTKVACE